MYSTQAPRFGFIATITEDPADLGVLGVNVGDDVEIIDVFPGADGLHLCARRLDHNPETGTYSTAGYVAWYFLPAYVDRYRLGVIDDEPAA